jgi:predicted acyltransferase
VNPNQPLPLASRIPAIDQFRGLAVLAMVLANFTGGMHIIPPWLKHAPDIGLTVIDLIAPMFILAIGLTYGPSFHRRLARDGAQKTYSRFAVRYLALIGIGAVISAGETALGHNPKGADWGVLQAIGAAGLVTLLVIRLPTWARLAIGLLLLGAYQWLLDTLWLRTVLGAPHGGLAGSLAWAAMLILATALGDLFHAPARRKYFGWAALLLLAMGIALAAFAPVSKNRVSSSYVLISLGVCALIFLAFHGLNQRFHWRARFLTVWGKNPLALYLLHYLIIGMVFLPGIPFLYADALPGLVLAEIALLIGSMTAVAYWLERRSLILSL